MKNANEKYIEYARVIQMCKGTKFENEPWKCVRINGECYLRDHPTFSRINEEDYTFAVAILEDEPLFVGDKVYWKHDGAEFEWGMVNHRLFAWSNDLTRTPPKRTFMLNGEELPCPNNTPNGLELRIIGFNDCAYHFSAVDDIRKVENAINNMLSTKC